MVGWHTLLRPLSLSLSLLSLTFCDVDTARRLRKPEMREPDLGSVSNPVDLAPSKSDMDIDDDDEDEDEPELDPNSGMGPPKRLPLASKGKEEKKMDIDDDDDDEDEEEGYERKEGKEGDSDEMAQWNDFVFTEYIRSVITVVGDPFKNIDRFMGEMRRLGVNTQRSRSRALAILDGLHKEHESQKVEFLSFFSGCGEGHTYVRKGGSVV